MRLVGGLAVLGAVVVQAAALGPLDAQDGFGGLAFGTPPGAVEELLPWGLEDGLEVHVAEMNPEVAGVRFEARQLCFWDGRLVQMRYLTTDFNASRGYFKLMVAAYGKPTSKSGPNSYAWAGRTVTASYAENDKTAVVTYGSVALSRERQRKSKRK